MAVFFAMLSFICQDFQKGRVCIHLIKNDFGRLGITTRLAKRILEGEIRDLGKNTGDDFAVGAKQKMQK